MDWAWSFSKISCSSLGRSGGEGPGRKREEGGSPAGRGVLDVKGREVGRVVKRWARGAELIELRVARWSVREGMESKMHFTTRPQRRHILAG